MKTAIILLSFILSFFFSNEEKVLVLKNVNVVNLQKGEIAYRYNVFIKDKKIWKVRPSRQTDKQLIVFPSIDMTGKYLLPSDLLDEPAYLERTATPEFLISGSLKCKDTTIECPTLTEGQEARFIILLANPLDQSLNNQDIEGIYTQGKWHSNH